MSFSFGAFVVETVFGKDGCCAFALGDGTVRFDSGETIEAHPDAGIQCAAAHPSGEGVITGGDDGRVVWSTFEGAKELCAISGKWIDAVASSAESNLIAFACGKEARVIDAKDAKFSRVFTHERSVANLAFDAKGRRLACATYGGAALWFARIEGQKPTMLKWAGSHVAVVFSPDGKFLISCMQENALHGWRVADAKDMRMGGYPAKPRSLSFLAHGALLATSGAEGAVVWPFSGANGPMGKQAAEIGHEDGARVTRVAGAPQGPVLAAGLEDGRVWIADLTARGVERLRADKGAAISALAISPDGKRVAWGDEDGEAGVADSPL
ncbi:MAG TPA: WD40 repeat domain-containing protein [Caulobacteraceae bacterium]|jgi:WD40 repeat protein|nr:WD40 repeat domain-containing protein [Caulobacteraceae bacterium]